MTCKAVALETAVAIDQRLYRCFTSRAALTSIKKQRRIEKTPTGCVMCRLVGTAYVSVDQLASWFWRVSGGV
jgi:hypothetical protein